MGPNGPDEELQVAIEAIRKAAVAAGKKTGVYSSSGEQGRKYADQGFNMVFSSPLIPLSPLLTPFQVAVAADVGSITKSVTDAVKTAKGSYGHAALNVAKGVVSTTASALSSKEKEGS